MKSDVIVRITISRGSFVLRFLPVSHVGSLAVGAFDFVNWSLSVFRFVPILNVGQQVS